MQRGSRLRGISERYCISCQLMYPMLSGLDPQLAVVHGYRDLPCVGIQTLLSYLSAMSVSAICGMIFYGSTSCVVTSKLRLTTVLSQRTFGHLDITVEKLRVRSSGSSKGTAGRTIRQSVSVLLRGACILRRAPAREVNQTC